MNVKSIFSNIFNYSTGEAAQVKMKELKSQASADRDANGGSAQGGEQQQSRQLNPEEMEKLEIVLQEMPGIKEGVLKYRFETLDSRLWILIEDGNGLVVKRIPENEFCFILDSRDQQTGRILRKAI